MSTRTITECDRCHREVRGEAKNKMVQVLVAKTTGQGRELCPSCVTALDRFLAGEDLEVPP